MKHPAKITISKPTCGNGEKIIVIRVKDTDASIRFLEVEIDFASFTDALTGLSEVNCEMEVFGLQNVGKKIERGELVFKMPKHGYSDRTAVAIEAAEKACPAGWTASHYFGSKSSFFMRDGEEFARTTTSRWVDK